LPDRPPLGSAIWAGLGIAALLWPARIAGPVDGAPLDFAVEACVAVAIAVILWLRPRLLRDRVPRALIVLLLLWKAGTALVTVQDGWCLKFVSPVPLYYETRYVPHAWDVRADWRANPPQCSAIMRRGYAVFDEFPIWFYNLPPVDHRTAAIATDRPPLVTLQLFATGFLTAAEAGTFRLAVGEHVSTRVLLDGVWFTHEQATAGIAVGSGTHRLAIEGDLRESRWALRPLWNDRDVFSASIATTAPAGAVDVALRPAGRYVPLLLVSAFLGYGVWSVLARTRSAIAVTFVVASASALMALPSTGSLAIMRVGTLVLLVGALLPWPLRLKNGFGASLLLGVPFMALFVALGLSQVGRVTLYSSGDDWWMFQRYAYRIYLQGYWLEGGQATFWFQPLYRWIAGALHLVFGDSSVGELWWDAACAAVGAFFTFEITRRIAGFRWAITFAAITLTIFTLGPAWYLFGRGLSELSSMGLIYAGALAASRARRGSLPAAFTTAICCGLAFYTRLNNLPMVLAISAFAFPTAQPVIDVWKPRAWLRRASRPTIAAVVGGSMLAMWLFTWRTWYYTGAIDMLYGTQAADRAVWKPEHSLLEGLGEVMGSLLMVISMNDPPVFDVRALPIAGGIACALAGIIGVGPLRRLPLNASVLLLSGLTGAVVARGSAYPGRFSLHIIPAAVAVFGCGLYLVVSAWRRSSSPLLDSARQGTTSGGVSGETNERARNSATP